MPAILKEIAQARGAGRRVLVLVPEQFTLLTERKSWRPGFAGLMDMGFSCFHPPSCGGERV
jgi:hypothetical protein